MEKYSQATNIHPKIEERERKSVKYCNVAKKYEHLIAHNEHMFVKGLLFGIRGTDFTTSNAPLA